MIDWDTVEKYKPEKVKKGHGGKKKSRRQYSVLSLPHRHEERDCIWPDRDPGSRKVHVRQQCPYFNWLAKQVPTGGM